MCVGIALNKMEKRIGYKLLSILTTTSHITDIVDQGMPESTTFMNWLLYNREQV